MEAFKIENLSFTYPSEAFPALRDINLSAKEGELILLCGPSGCGKSTLLRQLKPSLTPNGSSCGTVVIGGQSAKQLKQRDEAERIGFVQQDPDRQIVTDKVWHELAFGLESLGLPNQTIRMRVAEIASYFGIEDWFHKTTDTLTGGQKQLLNLAAVMVMQPKLLLLDEPTGQLDPIAATELLETIKKLNRDFGITVVLSEHRLDEALPMADRVIVLDGGEIRFDGPPQEVAPQLINSNMMCFLPVPTQIHAAVVGGQPCPLTVRQGRDWLNCYREGHPLLPEENVSQETVEEAVIRIKDACFRYEQNGADVLKHLSLSIPRGACFAITGGNGVGKSTLLQIMAGLCQPQSGKTEISGKTGLLPQDPMLLFTRSHVKEDLISAALGDEQERAARVQQVAEQLELTHLLQRHPYDLSGGEQQRAALAMVMLRNPEVLLLDEPTKGLDGLLKNRLATILADLCEQGVTVVMVSHDIEFCAAHATRCAMLFDGAVVAEGTPRTLFSGNRYYTTAASRMAHEWLPHAVTADDVIKACGKYNKTNESHPKPMVAAKPSIPAVKEEQRKDARLPLWRVFGGVLCAILIVAGLLVAWGYLPAPNGLDRNIVLPLLILLAAFAAVAFIMRPHTEKRGQRKHKKHISPIVAALVLLMPLTVLAGGLLLHDRKYYFISLLLLLEGSAAFFFSFEERKPQARELVVVAVLCALAVAGRMAFFMLPQFKPIMAIVILAGVGFGAETGFLVGAVSMLVSNMMFGQSALTPWQMFAMGLVGLIAGLLVRLGVLSDRRVPIAVYGSVAAIAVYGFLLNTATALIWQSGLNFSLLLTYYAAGFPMDFIQAAATFFFLWWLAEPILGKLERLKEKYGIGMSE